MSRGRSERDEARRADEGRHACNTLSAMKKHLLFPLTPQPPLKHFLIHTPMSTLTLIMIHTHMFFLDLILMYKLMMTQQPTLTSVP